MADDFKTGLETALQHAGAWVLMELQKLERGYTSLHPNEDLVAKGADLAKTEAQARGVAAADIDVSSQKVIETAQKIGASGADPHAVAAETKAADAPKADEPTMSVASTANDPPPPGAVVEGANEAAIQQGQTFHATDDVHPGTAVEHSSTGSKDSLHTGTTGTAYPSEGEHVPAETASPLTPPTPVPADPARPPGAV